MECKLLTMWYVKIATGSNIALILVAFYINYVVCKAHRTNIFKCFTH
ncbi:hypothetical protein KWV42_07510 [Clostridioides difficile]|nr:hypothetical protein [Clostridioides difficile]HBF2007923.1 hypothetical protein [Clostridioides difficile]HBG3583388.1 hypothetical protein [Clostridioides difficile]HBY2721400.1 hypothetical protein [Clostridioides difficile]HCH6635458.1 hypothetical protein [Clostridioides difficile]